MTEWRIEPRYKYDLANFCNLLSEDPYYTERHREVYEALRSRFDPAVTAQVKELLTQGILIGPCLCYALSVSDYDGPDIELLAAVLADRRLRESFAELVPAIPAIEATLRHAHSLFTWDYWHADLKPELDRRCAEFLAEARNYPVIELTRGLLGRDGTVAGDTITLYVSKLAAPHGISVTGSAFVADARWELKGQVAIATHEMMHPPFDRSDIGRLAAEIGSDDLLQEAKHRLPSTSGYASMDAFVEENIVEGAHVFLAEKMGVIDDALGYFVEHDYGSHILSVLVYDALRNGLRERVASLKEMIWLMKERGDIAPGAMRARYRAVFAAAGRIAECPYQA